MILSISFFWAFSLGGLIGVIMAYHLYGTFLANTAVPHFSLPPLATLFSLPTPFSLLY